MTPTNHFQRRKKFEALDFISLNVGVITPEVAEEKSKSRFV